jgi:DNA-binding PadR family transcriptional regulator
MPIKKEDNLPLSDSIFYIMLSLVQPLHGYAIMQHIDEISHHEMQIGPATLYTSLTKLKESKLIVERDDIIQSDERRKPYMLTPKGIRVLKAEIERRKRMLQQGLSALEKIGEIADE